MCGHGADGEVNRSRRRTCRARALGRVSELKFLFDDNWARGRHSGRHPPAGALRLGQHDGGAWLAWFLGPASSASGVGRLAHDFGPVRARVQKAHAGSWGGVNFCDTVRAVFWWCGSCQQDTGVWT